jgi:hypothetical protein
MKEREGSMIAFPIVVMVVLLAAVGSAQEPQPPPIEPELAPGSRLVDARADELVREMSELLSSTKSFALEAEEVYDEVPEHLPRTQLTSLRHIALRRPDRMVGDASGDALNRSFWYDGKTVSVLPRSGPFRLARNVFVNARAETIGLLRAD